MRGVSYTGRVLGGKYAIGALLGEGGWGSVYAATQTDLGRPVALKILHLDVAVSSEGIARFEREAKAAASFGHPNIVQVTDFQSNQNEPPFLVMEMLTGATLGSVLRRQKVLSASRVASIAYQVLSALDVAHRAGIVHRDVKPDNVFLVSMPGIEDLVKLLDFGIVKLSVTDLAQITSDGQMLGSPAFMSPEQVRAGPVDPRADLYSVGATMFYALAGRLPFESPNLAVLLSAIMDHPAPPLASLSAGIDPRFAAVVDRALQKDPALRFASAAEMRGALQPFTGASGPQITPSATPRTAAMVAVGPPNPTFRRPPSTAAMPIATPARSTGIDGPSFVAAARTPSTAASPGVAPPSRPTSSSPFVLVVVAGLVVAGLCLAAGAYWYAGHRSSSAEADASAPAALPSTAMMATATGGTTASAIATAAPSASTARGGATRILPPGPGPTPPPPVVVDAGGGVVIVDAGSSVRYGGATADWAGGSFEHYDIEAVRAEFERVRPQLSSCFAMTQFDPPDHQFLDWTVTVTPAGTVASVQRTTSFEPHPKLNPCIVAVVRTMRWAASRSGGHPHLQMRSRVGR